jgi:hypothetical protein
MKNLAERLIEQAKQNPYYHLEGYMERYWLYPFSKDNKTNIRIHRILSSDDDRHLHDHPWASTSIILKGGYWEVMPKDPLQHPYLDSDEKNLVKVWRREGDVVIRKANSRHRLILPEGTTTWSMFIMGEKDQSWGFYTEEGKIYWRDYLNDYTTITASDEAVGNE